VCWAILGAAMAIATGLILYLNRGTTFNTDELDWVFFTPNLSASDVLEPHNGNLIATTRLAYTAILETVGAEYIAFRLLGVVAVLLAGAFFYALAMIWLRRIDPAESHEAVVLHFSLVALGTMLVLAVPSWTWPDRESGLYLLGAGLGGGGAQLAMTRAYSLHRAAPVTALSTLGVVFTWLLALPLFPERPSVHQLAGTVLVLVATVLIGAATARPRYL
jgi:drug/metabolite transporter (DMT)-like permease